MEIQVITGNSNRALAEEIAKNLGIKLCAAKVNRFSDGETQVKIEDNVRGTDCFVIQPTCSPVNESVMELLVICDALRRSSARRITAVLPYYGYGRQDRKAEPRVPISSKLVANLIVASGVNRLLAMDLHAGQIQGFFDIPVDHLYAMPVFLEYLKGKNLRDLTIVSPDAGGVERARAFAKRLNADLVIVDKRRPKANEAEIMNVIGDVNGKTAVILDDIVDTAGTLCKVANAIKKNGASRVLAACSHGVLSGEACRKIEESALEELIVTDSIPLDLSKSPKVKVLTIAPLLASAIKNIHNDESISALFV
ncbi:MAG TPA: phosphoribosylpyrophosphate synthetase [Elusimicrobia bacterium]|nr:MAG: phosphoribosylpyrophosphate synthetase [Elusimicrobia bacterium RIFOXYA12_FULL_49_49]OGS10099.1 MAG: phosphoribosylpyrophosphate synthetase [Elusimicrobia bacterium RIFOXYA1_FULL_47_7]OGS16272.1 MAG: phosphoribosylpyrophosphate synthetase [Elusimicrobia bacterium RIFOXYA2_FULL_47_53]OGS31427.1 MAG: phosphoribosylpyrophosphate synthetase [Elusimicrobia bacterium RIFOXYB2_FULL_46_23]HBU70031.1 phosphoribosylpyrophosphate synthetase [Elusimicrobiota bacterium]